MLGGGSNSFEGQKSIWPEHNFAIEQAKRCLARNFSTMIGLFATKIERHIGHSIIYVTFIRNIREMD